MMKQIIRFILGRDTNAILNKIQSYKDETSQIESQHKSLLQDNSAIKKSIDNCEKNVHTISQEIDQQNSKISAKRFKCETLDNITKTKEDISGYEKKMNDCTANIHRLKQSVDSLIEEINKQNERKSELEARYKELNTDINETITNIDEYRSVNSEIKNIQDWLLTHSAELTGIQKKINTRIQEIEDTEQRIDITNNDPEAKEKEQNVSISIEDNDKSETKAVKDSVQRGSENSFPNESVEGKRKKRDRKIKEIFDLKTGETILADQFFEQPINELVRWRSLFQECISKDEHRFICPNCLEQIRISGQGDERGIPSIFTHKNDSVDCTKTTTGLSVEEINKRKYSLVGQSLRHKELKNIISDFLKDEGSVAIGIKNVETEKRVYSSLPYFNWRQPDIQIEYKDCKIVFEIQLSTIFLSVITERDTFYRLNNYYIIWVFNFDDNKKYVDLNNLAIKDIYFANKRNAFIFDQDALQWSKERKQLVLKCNWVDTNSQWHYPNTSERIGGEPVTLEQLKFDEQSLKPYYFDAEKPYFEEHPEMAERFAAEQRTREEHIKELEQKAAEKETNRQTAIEKMKATGESVIAYKEKTKFGFKYGTTDIIEPHFTSCEERDNGTFIVGYNKKKGLVNQYGEIIRECKYVNIHSLSGNAYLAEDLNYFWLCNIQSYFRGRTTGDKVISTQTNKRVEKVELFHRNGASPFCRFYVLDGHKLLAEIDCNNVFVDIDGNKIVDEQFINMRFLSNNMIRVQRKKDHLWNDMDYDGTFLSNWTKYISIEQWGNGLQIGEYQTEKNWYSYSKKYFDIISTNGQIISGGISSIGKLINGKAQAIINGVQVEIGTNGELIPEQELQFPNNYTAIKLLGYWKLTNQEGKDIITYNEEISSITYIDKDLFIIKKHNNFGLAGSNGIIILCQYNSIVPWASGIFKVCSYGYQELKNESGKTIGNRYDVIGNLENGRAEVRYKGATGHIDAKGMPIPDVEIKLTDGFVKYGFMMKWGLKDSVGKNVLNCEYMDITSFHGYYYAITLDGKLKRTNTKTQNVVPVKGRKIKETKSSIIYNVGNMNLLVRLTMAKKIWNDQIPDTADLLITHINKEHKKSGRYHYTNLHIYAKPYSQQEKEMESNNNKKIDIDEIVNGVIVKVKNGSAIVKLDDGATIFIHKSYFNNNVINGENKGHNITVKMIGFDDVHQKEKWEIIELSAPQV